VNTEKSQRHWSLLVVLRGFKIQQNFNSILISVARKPTEPPPWENHIDSFKWWDIFLDLNHLIDVDEDKEVPNVGSDRDRNLLLFLKWYVLFTFRD
jgi:hypothetical protein